MYRGEDEITWILFQRRKLDQERFLARLRRAIDTFRPDLDFAAAPAYQGFTSRTFVEFTTVLEPYFPGLAPQDFCRYKTVQQLINQFGAVWQPETGATISLRKQEVVVAGMSCKFPAATENPAQYWRMLLSGEDQVRPDPLRGDFEAGFLDREVSKFDHKYFNISDAEAKTMDPQQILALELTELLWKDAGIDPETLNRKRVGVYIGVWNEEYRGLARPELGEQHRLLLLTGGRPLCLQGHRSRADRLCRRRRGQYDPRQCVYPEHEKLRLPVKGSTLQSI